MNKRKSGGGKRLVIGTSMKSRGRVKSGRTKVEVTSADEQPNREMRRAVLRQARRGKGINE